MFNILSLLQSKPGETMVSPESNDDVRAQLAAFDDDGRLPRHVLHYAYPIKGADLSQRSSMVDALGAQGFDVRDAVEKHGLVLEHHRPVAADDFDELTGQLSEYFATCGWAYDGWECAVETGEELDAVGEAAE